jgi:tight adherence protein B
MNATMITWMTFAGVTLLATVVIAWAHEGALGYRSRLYARMRTSLGSGASIGHGSLFNDRKSVPGCADRSLRGRSAQLYEQSYIALSCERYCAAVAAASACLGLAAWFFTNVWWTAPLVVAAGVAAGAAYVVSRRAARMRQLLLQLPKALDVIGRAIQAGQTVPAAFQIVADDLDSPIADEFRRCYEEQHLGVSFESALRNLAQRTALMELRILIVALLVQSRSGGNLVALLRDLSGLVQKRLKLEQRVRALTGEGRMQAVVLIVLPTAAFGLLYFLAPDYIAVLLDRPSLIVASLTAQGLGAIWIRRCIRIEY